MTTAEPNRNDLDAGDSQDAQCLLYLLGELDAETSKRFEEKLAGNAELSEALLQQASLITAIAQSRAFDRRTLPDAGSKHSHPYETQRWRWIAAVASVAACIALAVQFLQFASPSGTTASTKDGAAVETAALLDESVLIAKAWASSQHTLTSETADSQSGQSELDELAGSHADESYDLVLDDQPSDIDSAMSWMFVAISSSPDVQREEGNDG